MHLRRRLLLLGATAALVPLYASAQSRARSFRVAFLAVTNPTSAERNITAFLTGLRERGYTAGENLIVDIRYAEGDRSRLPRLADELLTLRPDVVVGTEDAIVVMRSKTKTVPLVVLSSVDPVAAGLADSLSRPGGNVTGIAALVEDLFQKQFQLLIDCLPRLQRVVVLNDTTASYSALYSRFGRRAAEALRLSYSEIAVTDRPSVAGAFLALKADRPDALAVVPSGLTYVLRREIAAEAQRLRLPTVFSLAPYADAGGLLSYGDNQPETFRYAAVFVDRILKGVKPADLPIEQITKPELVINLKTATALGIHIPLQVRLRADRLIE